MQVGQGRVILGLSGGALALVMVALAILALSTRMAWAQSQATTTETRNFEIVSVDGNKVAISAEVRRQSESARKEGEPGLWPYNLADLAARGFDEPSLRRATM